MFRGGGDDPPQASSISITVTVPAINESTNTYGDMDGFANLAEPVMLSTSKCMSIVRQGSDS